MPTCGEAMAGSVFMAATLADSAEDKNPPFDLCAARAYIGAAPEPGKPFLREREDRVEPTGSCAPPPGATFLL